MNRREKSFDLEKMHLDCKFISSCARSLGDKGMPSTNQFFTARTDNQPKIKVALNENSKITRLSPGNHFKNMLDNFYQQKVDRTFLQNQSG